MSQASQGEACLSEGEWAGIVAVLLTMLTLNQVHLGSEIRAWALDL